MIIALSVLSIPVLLVFLVLVIAKHVLRNLNATLANAGEQERQMATYTSKHSPDELAHGAKMPSVGTKQNDKTVAPNGGNTKSAAVAQAPAPKTAAVNQDYTAKPAKMPKAGHTS